MHAKVRVYFCCFESQIVLLRLIVYTQISRDVDHSLFSVAAQEIGHELCSGPTQFNTSSISQSAFHYPQTWTISHYCQTDCISNLLKSTFQLKLLLPFAIVLLFTGLQLQITFHFWKPRALLSNFSFISVSSNHHIAILHTPHSRRVQSTEIVVGRCAELSNGIYYEINILLRWSTFNFKM